MINQKENKIAIVGISASGKSFFARNLGNKTGLIIYHMDKLFWKDNWQEIPEQEYLKEHEKLIEKDKWIIEGYIDSKMANRLEKSDLVIFLDYPGAYCAWQLIKRWLTHRKVARPELPKEAIEKFKMKFFWIVLTRGERKDALEAIKIAKPKNLVILKSPKQTKQFLDNYTR